MIREIINYTKYLKEKSPKIFEEGLELRNGVYFIFDYENESIILKETFVYETDKNPKSNLKELAYKISKAWTIDYAKQPYYQKCLDLPQKRIHSVSPYLVAFKRTYLKGGKEYERKSKSVDIERIEKYLNKVIKETINNDDNAELIAKKFKELLKKNFLELISNNNINNIKNDDYIFIVLNIDKSYFDKAFSNYLKVRVFNSAKENLITVTGEKIKKKDITKHNEILGMSNYFSGYNIDKPFKRHLTSFSYVNQISNKDASILFEFKELVSQKVFPNPLPIFIDENEFSTSDEIIKIFRKDDKLTYSQILKQIFKNTPDKVLQNYYLLFFNYKYELEDFDFVSKFRYSMEENGEYPVIKNLFEIKLSKDEFKRDYPIKNIFQFEADIVKTIFNNSLVKVKDESFSVNYFGEIKAEYVSGGEPVYQMMLKYRKAFYDYIYKSKTQTIDCTMWDEIMWNSIIGDLRNTNFDKKYFIEQSIKEKLNIWFSLYNYFTNNKNRTDMASKIPELLEKMKQVANDENAHFETTEDFAFGAGQIIFYLLNQSKASERTHALLEPFIQKVKAEQLQSSIAQAVNMYKYEISFGHGRFERLSSEVLAFETDDNLKNYQRFLLAGYFATPVIYEKKESNNKNN